jgi:CheY-like chemotaxis protein
MEAVGRLASGIAHDFNDILTVIRAHGEFLKEAIPAGTEQRDDLEEIRRAATRATSLTRQLLAFARQQALDPQPVDINAMVTELQKTLARLIGDDIELVTQTGSGVGQSLIDRGQVEQVLIDLAVNALDAMPKGGTLTIATSVAELEQSALTQPPETKAGTYVTLHVKDTGTGMDDATLARIFEPFFTTKAPGKGAGLGLATVYGVVQQSGGFVQVTSAPGEGTAFKVFLPQLSGTGAVAMASTSSELPGLEGTETILLVEDEDAIRTLARRILARLGYTVIEARHGGEALTVAADYEGPFHLVVSDAKMPQMSGPDLTRALRVLRAELPVLLVSGCSDDDLVRSGTLDERTSFLHKPFAAEQLARAVREALDRKPPSA